MRTTQESGDPVRVLAGREDLKNSFAEGVMAIERDGSNAGKIVAFAQDREGWTAELFAGVGKGIGVVDDGLFSAVVLLVMITTVLAPIMLRVTMGANSAAPPEPVASSGQHGVHQN